MTRESRIRGHYGTRMMSYCREWEEDPAAAEMHYYKHFDLFVEHGLDQLARLTTIHVELDKEDPSHSVYFLWKDSALQYIGKSKSPAERILSHRKMKNFNAISIYSVGSPGATGALESALIALFRPPNNRTQIPNTIDPVSSEHTPQQHIRMAKLQLRQRSRAAQRRLRQHIRTAQLRLCVLDEPQRRVRHEPAPCSWAHLGFGRHIIDKPNLLLWLGISEYRLNKIRKANEFPKDIVCHPYLTWWVDEVEAWAHLGMDRNGQA